MMMQADGCVALCFLCTCGDSGRWETEAALTALVGALNRGPSMAAHGVEVSDTAHSMAPPFFQSHDLRVLRTLILKVMEEALYGIEQSSMAEDFAFGSSTAADALVATTTAMLAQPYRESLQLASLSVMHGVLDEAQVIPLTTTANSSHPSYRSRSYQVPPKFHDELLQALSANLQWHTAVGMRRACLHALSDALLISAVCCEMWIQASCTPPHHHTPQDGAVTAFCAWLQKQGVNQLVKALAAHPNDSTVQTYGCAAFAALGSCELSPVREAVASQGGVAAMLAAMEAHRSSALLQKLALQVNE